MKLFRSTQDTYLDQAISELRGEKPDAKALAASTERVWKRLQTGEGEAVATSSAQPIRGCADIRSLLPAFNRQEFPPAPALIVKNHLRECVSCRSYAYGHGVDGATRVAWRMEQGARRVQGSLVRLTLGASSFGL